MRTSDIIFFGTIFFMLILLYIDAGFKLHFPQFIYYSFFGFLLVIVIIKQFFPKSKIAQWLAKENFKNIK